MSTKKVTPITNGVKFTPGMKYMINTDTGVIFPWNAMMMKHSDNLRELTPPTINVIDDTQVEEATAEEEIVVEPITIDVPKSTLKPWELAQIAKQQKKAEKASVKE